MIFGMPTLIELNGLEETMDLCKELELSFVELNMNLPQYQVEHLEKTDYLQGMKERYDLFFTIHLDENLNICDFNQAVAGAYMETVEITIEVAKKLKVPVLNMHMNHGIYLTLPDRKEWLFEHYKDRYMECMMNFKNRCEAAIGDAAVKICIENTDGYLPYEREAIKMLLESKAFGLTWDIGHSHTCENVDEEFLMSYEEKLHHFHIHDGLDKKNHMILGTGEVNLGQRLSLAHKHDCSCVLETKTVDGLRKSVKWMKENEYMVECPCKRLNCSRHGDCAACREHHDSFKSKMRVACDRLKKKVK